VIHHGVKAAMLMTNPSGATACANRLGHLIQAEDGVHDGVRQLETIAAQQPARD
jgi:hypothetical protein